MLDYRGYIVSTQEYCTFLHRTSRKYVPEILETGLICSLGADLRSSATLQPRELDKAEVLYRGSWKHNNSVVVFQIPRKRWEEATTKYPERELADFANGLGYPRRDGKGIALRPEFCIGWIDKANDEVHLKGEKIGETSPTPSQ